MSELNTASQIAAGELTDPEIRRQHDRITLPHTVAMRVIGCRIDHGLSQTGLAWLLGLHEPAVARLEAGHHWWTSPSAPAMAPAGSEDS